MDIGTIFGLLLLLLPVAAKMIEKSLAKAGNTGGAKKMRDFADMFGDDSHDDGDVETKEVFPALMPGEEYTATFTDDAVSGEPDRMPLPEEGGYRSVEEMIKERFHASSDQDQGPEHKTMGIDPKKLIIYSEIMKPKF